MRRFLGLCGGWALVGVGLWVILGRNTYLGMIWNLFLALVPLVFSWLLIHKWGKGWLGWVLFAVWLVLIPNAFYMVTDLIHISQLRFYYFLERYSDFSKAIYAENVGAWVEMFYLTSGFLLGLVAGLKSMRDVMGSLGKKVKERKKFLVAVGGMVLLIGFGMWMGRFLRLNSWDVLMPWRIFIKVFQEFDWFAVWMTVLFAGYVGGVYGICWWMGLLKNDRKR